MSDDRLATRVVHAGLDPDPSYGSVIPAIHQTSTFRQERVGEFVEDFDYARSANPTRAALERALVSWRAATGPPSPPGWRRPTPCSPRSARPATTS
jgi:cystathionine beta-lyase/cystathionine gamma-synthase